MQYKEIYDSAKQNLSHQVRAFEVLRSVIHTTILFGVGSSAAVASYALSQIGSGNMWVGIGCLLLGVYISIITLFFVGKEYKSLSSPADGVEPQYLLQHISKNSSESQFYTHELKRIQHKIDRYMVINGKRGRNLNLFVKALVYSPIGLLLYSVLAGLLHLACLPI